MNLGTLVRVPGFKEFRCPRAVSKPCTLVGTNLFLAHSFASATDFENAAEVPADFTGAQLTVPHPTNGVLYLKLRDDPETVQTLTLPVTPLPASAQFAVPTTAAQSQPSITPPAPDGDAPAPAKPE